MDYSLVPSVAILSAAEAIHERYPDELFGPVGTEAQLLAIDAAAPHIARKARIDELKLVIGNCVGVGPHDSDLAVTMRTLQERVAELEADHG
jgi:hypothetical protein